MAVGDARDDERGQEASLVPRDVHDPEHQRGRRGVLRRKTKAEKPDDDKRRLRAFFGAIADKLIDTAPGGTTEPARARGRIPVRDLATLRAQFPGQGPEEIADQLVSTAMKGSAAVGAGVGAAAMLPVPPAMPAELTAEIVGVASVELKLVAELHELYGQRAPGNVRERGITYLSAWVHERGIDPAVPATVSAALGIQLRRELRQRMAKRTVRNLPNLAPFMIGAVVGAMINRRDTKKLAERIRRDLRKRQVEWDALPQGSQQPQLTEGSQTLRADSSDDTRRSG